MMLVMVRCHAGCRSVCWLQKCMLVAEVLEDARLVGVPG